MCHSTTLGVTFLPPHAQSPPSKLHCVTMCLSPAVSYNPLGNNPSSREPNPSAFLWPFTQPDRSRLTKIPQGCWLYSFSGRHSQALCLLLSCHVHRQKRHNNPNLSPLPGVSLGPWAEGISQSMCQLGAFCWPGRGAGRRDLKSTSPSPESRADLPAVISQSLSQPWSCCGPITSTGTSDLTAPFTAIGFLLD